MTEEELEHDAKRRKAEARDLVTSWVLAIWALAAGCYLTGGGAKHLNSPAYHYVLEWVGGDYHTVGVILLVAAVVNMVGVGTNQTGIMGLGAILVGGWLFVISIGMGLATFRVSDGGNLNWMTAIGLACCYFIRAYNKINPPKANALMGFLSLAVMPFVV